MKLFMPATIAAALLMCLASPSFAGPPPGYTLAWSDEFNQGVGATPNPATWNYNVWESGRHNGELQAYVKDARNAHIIADPAATDGQALQIQATTDGKGNYASARIHSARKVTVQYGYLEARIKVPYSQGMWPAFWMMGTNDNSAFWPDCGEIDIQESMGSEPSINHGSFHGPDHSGDDCLTAIYTLQDGRQFKDSYHTFGLLWSENSMTLDVDGVPYETRTPADTGPDGWAYNHEFFIILNLAVGGHFPGKPDATTIFPQNFLIDYIRLYKYTATKPVHGPHAIPGTIKTADYDAIGTAPAMHAPHYSVNVDSTSAYRVTFEVAPNAKKRATFHLEDESGNNLTGPIKTAKEATITRTVTLPAGFNVLTLVGDHDNSLTSMTFTAIPDLVSGGVYKLGHSGTDGCLDMGIKTKDVVPDASNPREGAAARQWHDTGSDAQRWIIKPHGPYYTLTHKGTSYCLTADATAVTQSTCTYADNQLWTVTEMSDGSYTLTNKAVTKPLAVVAGSDADAAAIDLQSPLVSDTARWSLVLTGLPGQP